MNELPIIFLVAGPQARLKNIAKAGIFHIHQNEAPAIQKVLQRQEMESRADRVVKIDIVLIKRGPQKGRSVQCAFIARSERDPVEWW